MPTGQRNLHYSFYQSESFFIRLGRFVGEMPAAMLLLAVNRVAAFRTQCQNRSHKLIYQQPKWQNRPPYENIFSHVGLGPLWHLRSERNYLPRFQQKGQLQCHLAIALSEPYPSIDI